MKRIIIMFCCVHFIILNSAAQNSISPILYFVDSLQANDSSSLLHAELKIKFSTPNPFNYSMQIQPPTGWRLIGGSKLSFKRIADTLVRITLLRTRYAQSKWSPVKVQVFDSVSNSCLDTFFHIRAPWRSDFQLVSSDSIIELADTVRFAAVKFRLINKGSVEGFYRVFIKKNAQVISTLTIPSILPGSDTLLYVPLLLPRTILESQVRLQVYVVDSLSQSRTFPISVVRRFTSLKVNPSSYGLQQLTIESGLFLLEKKMYHFHEARTLIHSDKGDLQFSFRTRAFGQTLSVERNILTLGFVGKKARLLFGQLSDNTHFFSLGRGISIQLNPTAKQEWGGKFILRNDKTVYTNNSFLFYTRHQQRSFRFLHQLAIDFDKIRGNYGYLMHHELDWHQTERFTVKAIFAAGVEEFKKRRVFHSGDLGIGLGASSLLKLPQWELGGDIQYYQKSFPGINKGLRNYQLDIRRIFKKYSTGLFYRYNYVSIPILFDSVYIMDAFKFNMERMGFRFSLHKATYHFSLSGGHFRQVGLTAGQLDQYLFLDKSIGWQSAKKIRLQLSALSGISRTAIKGKEIWFTNTSLDMKWQRGGVKGFFVRQPILSDSTVKVLVRNVETMILSPYFNFKFLKRIPVSLRYTISKSLYDKTVTQGIGFSLQYKSKISNWQIQCNGTVPLTTTTANQAVLASFPYVTLSLQKAINVPTIFKKKYYTLRVLVFEDVNSNGAYDLGEPRLRGIRFAVNHLRFLTDSIGCFTISNTNAGPYEIMAESGYATQGLTPVAVVTTINLTTSQLVYISFRKGHAIGGLVKFDLDPYSRKQITPENILINFVDQAGKKFSTLTDTTGKFYIKLPAGVYSVSLNETSFTGPIRPVVNSFQVDIQQNAYQFIEFELREKRREIRLRNH